MALWTPSAGAAQALVIKISGIAAPLGMIGCALYADEKGFPMETSSARTQWVEARAEAAICRFDDVAPGRYAVSVSHDANGNRKLDTNLLGIPTEQWGVSNNVRPLMRAPRFEEAAFVIPLLGNETPIEIRIAK